MEAYVGGVALRLSSFLFVVFLSFVATQRTIETIHRSKENVEFRHIAGKEDYTFIGSANRLHTPISAFVPPPENHFERRFSR